MGKTSRRYVIGMDIGGTKILTALMDEHFRIRASAKTKANVGKGEKIFMKTLMSQVGEVLNDAGVPSKALRAVGVGCPGMISYPGGVVELSPNIPFLRNYPLRKRLEKYFHTRVMVENDVNAGLYGELHFGAAEGCRHVAGIFLGTGVGGALVLDGKLYRGAHGGAGEIGHTFLSLDTHLTGLRRSGTLEMLTGRLAIASEAALLIMKQRARHLNKLTDGDMFKIKSGALAKAIRAGDRAVKELVLAKAKLVGVAMANVVNLLNPERIVLGGGLVEALGWLVVPEARRAMKKYAMPPLVKSVDVREAKLGDFAVAKGAARLAFEAYAH